MAITPQQNKKYTIQETHGIDDPMLSDNFILYLTGIPTATGFGSDITEANSTGVLSIMCQQVVKPGLTVEPVEIALWGHKLQYAGIASYSHDLSITFVEDWKGHITRTIEAWMNLCRSPITQKSGLPKNSATCSGSGKSYAITADLRTIGICPSSGGGGEGDTYLGWKIYGLWPTAIPDIQFTGESSTAITHSVNFKYDYYELVQVGGEKNLGSTKDTGQAGQ